MNLYSSPWGPVQDRTSIANGISQVSTASHGGLKLDAVRQTQMPPFLKPTFPDGWYEEDCDWAKVAVVFPQFFAAHDVSNAVRTIKRWEAANPEALAYVAAGEAARIAAEYDLAHANDWTVTACGTAPAGHNCWLVVLTHRTHPERSRRGVMSKYPRQSVWTDEELRLEMIDQTPVE